MRMDPANGVIEVGNILLAPVAAAHHRSDGSHVPDGAPCLRRPGLSPLRVEVQREERAFAPRGSALGFTFEGIFRQHMVVKGQNRDTAWFSMLDSEWPARKAAFEAWLDPANFDGRRPSAQESYATFRLRIRDDFPLDQRMAPQFLRRKRRPIAGGVFFDLEARNQSPAFVAGARVPWSCGTLSDSILIP